MDTGFLRPARPDRRSQRYSASGRRRAVCVDGVTVQDASGKTLEAMWKPGKPDEIQMDIPLDAEKAGTMNLPVNRWA